MSFSDDEFDDNIDSEIFLDSDIEDEPENKFILNKKAIELDNNDNENDYIDDEHEEDNEDITEDNDIDDDADNQDENKNYMEDTINFNDNDLDNDSKFQYIVKDDERRTSNRLTVYELTELISIRGNQIANGSHVFVDITGLTDPIEMAKKEINNNKCPLFIKRFIGLDKYELWCPNFMSKPKL